MGPNDLKRRSRKAALDVISAIERLTIDRVSDVMTKQWIRSATSTAANYRAVCRAKSRPDFINKLNIVIEEADESMFWLEMLVDAGKLDSGVAHPLIDEFSQLLKIFVASRQTAKSRS